VGLAVFVVFVEFVVPILVVGTKPLFGGKDCGSRRGRDRRRDRGRRRDCNRRIHVRRVTPESLTCTVRFYLLRVLSVLPVPLGTLVECVSSFHFLAGAVRCVVFSCTGCVGVDVVFFSVVVSVSLSVSVSAAVFVVV
jgi:hypothetical protein